MKSVRSRPTLMFVGSSLISVLVIAACGTQSTAAVHHSGPNIVHVALGDDPKSLDPQAVEDGYALDIYDNISEALIFRNSLTNKLEPGLALSWSNTDPNTWEFKLRPNVTFSDGEPFNADAVVYSIDRIIDPNYITEQSDWFGVINGAKKVDDLTVDITTSVPDPQVPMRLDLIMMVPPVASKRSDFAIHPIGTGPYVLDTWIKGGITVIKARSDYWGGKPAIDEATFQPITEPTVKLSGLKRGELNLVPELLPEQMSQTPQPIRTAGLEFPVMILDTRGGPFQDVRVRQAANYAVDKATILAKLYNGYGTIANCQLMGSAVFGYNPDLKPYPYDPAKAMSLLQAAGVPHPSVTLIGESGRFLKDGEFQQVVAGYLEKVGFTVNIKTEDYNTWLTDLFPTTNSATTPRPEMIWVSHDNVLGDADVTFSTYYQSTGPGASTSDPQMDQMIVAGRTELNRSTRLSEYQAINKLGCDNADFIFGLNVDNIYGLSADLNWRPRYDGWILVKTMSWK
jgi:peptide/nickel transport system substrate-binding protein